MDKNKTAYTDLRKQYEKKWYPAQATQAAFLLGGIGTGNVSLGSRGQLMDWELFNRPGKGIIMPYSFFAIRVKPQEGDAVCKVLESKLQPPFVKGLGYLSHEASGLPRFESSRMAAEYPFAEVVFEDKQVPADVSLEAFTPFIPLDADNSGIPGAVLRYRVKNTSGQQLSVTIAGSLCNATGYKGYDINRELILDSNVKNDACDEDGLHGIFFTNPDAENEVLRYNSMAIATSNPNVTRKTTWLHEGWFDGAQDFWDDFCGDGLLELKEAQSSVAGKIAIDTYKVGSLGVVEKIAPGEEKIFEFVLSWYFPYRTKSWEIDDVPSMENSIKNYYGVLFKSAWEAASYLTRNLTDLERKSRVFQQALYSTTMPGHVVEAVADNITVLRSPTCFRIEDGTFLAWEGCQDLVGSCSGTCTHVWNYAQTLAFLFPKLEQSARNVEFLLETDESGLMTFRTHQIFNKPRWNPIPAADGQPGTIVRLYREWKLSGDSQFLDKLWPKAKSALDFIISQWDANGDGVMEGEQHNTYDIEFYGKSSMTNALFYAALKAGAEMATQQNDLQSARKYEDLLQKGSKNMDALLWNGEYYIQDIEDVNEYKYQYGEGCLSDQLFGQFLAHVSGLGYVLPQEHVKKAIHSVYRYNLCRNMGSHSNAQRTYAFNGEQGLLLCSWPKGGRPALPFVYADEVWTGIEYQVAAHLIYEGFVDEGLEVTKVVRDRQDGYKRSPWNEVECGNHYTRSMASWALLTALSGYRFDMTKGEISFDPLISEDNFSTFWSTAVAWGTYTQTRNQDGSLQKQLQVLYGDKNAVKLV